jgi:hypothetical protein
MGSGGGGTSTTVQQSEPWKEQIPYLTSGFQNAQQWYDSSNPQYYDFPTTVPYSSQTQQALAAQQQQATQGSPFVGTAGSYLNNLLGGSYLNSNPAMGTYGAIGSGALTGSNPAYGYLPDIAGGGAGANTDLLQGMATDTGTNPYLDAMFKQGADALGSNFRDTINPGMQAYWEGIGGSPANPSAQLYGQKQLQDNYIKPMGDLATSFYGGQYQADQARRLQAAQSVGQLQQGNVSQQLQATGQLGQLGQEDIANILSGAGGMGNLYSNAQAQQLAGLGSVPSIQQAPYTDISKLGEVGAANESKAMEDLQAQMAQFQFNQNKPLDKLQQYMQLIGGANYGGTTTSTGPNPYASNPYGDMGSMAMMGAMLPKMMGV